MCTLIYTITISPLPRKVEISKSRRKQYYTKKDKLNKTIQDKLKRNLMYFDTFGKLRDSISKTQIIKNSKSHSTPKTVPINGQHIYNTGMSYIMRSRYINLIKDLLEPYFKNVPPIDPKLFPIMLSAEIICDLGAGNWDLDNLAWIYSKCIQDIMVSKGIIPEDNVCYITRSMGLRFVQKIKSDIPDSMVIFVDRDMSPMNRKVISEFLTRLK